MKKNFTAVFILVLLATTFNSPALAQLVSHATVSKNEEAVMDLSNKSRTSYNSPAVLQLNPKAVARFTARFPDAQSPVWTKKEGYLFVNFILNGQKASAVFTRKGRIRYSIISLLTVDMPEIIKKEVRETYPSHSVLYARRITRGYDTMYEVILENCAGYVVIHSTAEEIAAIDTVNKSID